jgi:hypothetical protein
MDTLGATAGGSGGGSGIRRCVPSLRGPPYSQQESGIRNAPTHEATQGDGPQAGQKSKRGSSAGASGPNPPTVATRARSLTRGSAVQRVRQRARPRFPALDGDGGQWMHRSDQSRNERRGGSCIHSMQTRFSGCPEAVGDELRFSTLPVRSRVRGLRSFFPPVERCMRM